MTKKILAFIPSLFFLKEVSAHCPLCTGAIVAGSIGAKYLGLDITIFGIFVGAFAISLGLFISNKIKNYFKYQKSLIILVSFLLTIIPILSLVKDTTYISLSIFGLLKVYFVNKLLLGSIIGSLATLLAYYLHNYIKLKNNGVLFPYQGLVLTVLFLILASVPTYFVFN